MQSELRGFAGFVSAYRPKEAREQFAVLRGLRGLAAGFPIIGKNCHLAWGKETNIDSGRERPRKTPQTPQMGSADADG